MPTENNLDTKAKQLIEFHNISVDVVVYDSIFQSRHEPEPRQSMSNGSSSALLGFVN